jgi:hypothetical protein
MASPLASQGCYRALTIVTPHTWLVHTSCRPCTHDACCKQLQEPLHRLTTAHPHQTTPPTDDSPKPLICQAYDQASHNQERLADHSEHFPQAQVLMATHRPTSAPAICSHTTQLHPAPPSPKPLYSQSVAKAVSQGKDTLLVNPVALPHSSGLSIQCSCCPTSSPGGCAGVDVTTNTVQLLQPPLLPPASPTARSFVVTQKNTHTHPLLHAHAKVSTLAPHHCCSTWTHTTVYTGARMLLQATRRLVTTVQHITRHPAAALDARPAACCCYCRPTTCAPQQATSPTAGVPGDNKVPGFRAAKPCCLLQTVTQAPLVSKPSS